MKGKKSKRPTVNRERGAKKNTRRIQARKSTDGLRVLNEHAAGVDVGAEKHFFAVPPRSVPKEESAVRSYSAFTFGLDASVEWLKQCGVTTVAMESTGVYWIPLAQKLEEARIEVVLVNARHVKNVPGRKTDVLDCQWLQELHSYGLLSGSFRPSDEICRLRSIQRHRANLVSSASAEIQHMQKALQQMNLHLHHVVSDINGVTGMRILDAIIKGERNPKELAKLREGRTRSTVDEIEKALTGDYREEHLFVLGQSLEAYRFFQDQMARCDQQIKTMLEHLAKNAQAEEDESEDQPPEGGTPAAQIASEPGAGAAVPRQDAPTASREPQGAQACSKKVPSKRLRKLAGNEPGIDFKEHLRSICGVDLTAVLGLNILSALILISEIGTDMSRWRSAKAFCSWLGLSPGNKISGGKVLNSRTRHVVSRAATILRVAATTVGRSDSCLGHFYRRKKAHLGAAKATTATARKLACIVYLMLKHKQEYQEPDTKAYQARILKGRLRSLQKQAEILGYSLVASASAAA